MRTPASDSYTHQKRHLERGATTLVAALALSLTIGVAATVLYQRSDSELYAKDYEDLRRTAWYANLSALQLTMELYTQDVVKIEQQDGGFSYTATQTGRNWKLDGASIKVTSCNPAALPDGMSATAATYDALLSKCPDKSDQFETVVTMDTLDLTSNKAVLNASTPLKNSRFTESKVDTKAELIAKPGECTNLMEPGQGVLAHVTWRANGNGLNGNSSDVWVIPSLYTGGRWVGDDYEFEFYIYWMFHRELMNGYTWGTVVRGADKLPAGTVGCDPKYGCSKGDMSWGIIAKSLCNVFNTCSNGADQSNSSTCLSGNACDRMKVLATIVDAKSNKSCKLLTTAVRFYHRTDGGGCFIPGTKITMADGSLKRVEDVQTGDLVLNPVLGRAMSVGKVIGGPEAASLVRLQAKGRELVVTRDHPVLTQRGLVTAGDVETGDSLQDGDGEWQPVTLVAVDDTRQGGYVFNIQLDTPAGDPSHHYVEANGLISGDLYLQTRLGAATAGDGTDAADR